MLLIFGANGRVGSLLVKQLLNHGERVRVFVRDQDKAQQLFSGQTDIVQGDLNDHQSIRAALTGVAGVFLNSPVSPNQVEQQNAVVDAAVKAEHPYIVKLSGLATYADSFVDSGRWHAQTEQYLRQSGLDFTCLHPYFFMQNLGLQLDQIRNTGIIRSAVPRAPIAMIDARDIASVAAHLLRNPLLAVGKTLPLTCHEALTYSEIAQIMSRTFDLPISFESISINQLEQNLIRSGQPDWHIRILLQFNKAFNEGLGGTVHPAVQDLLGRSPSTVGRYLEARIDSIKPLARGSDPFPT